jgi:magnesium transporter
MSTLLSIEILKSLDATAAALSFHGADPNEVAQRLLQLGPRMTSSILGALEPDIAAKIIAQAPPVVASVWQAYGKYSEHSIGKLIEAPAAEFRPETSVADVVSQLRESVKRTLITYIFVTDSTRKLVGLVTFRELLYSAPTQRLEEIMLRNPYALKPETPMVDAMRDVVKRHFPVYPVVQADGTLIGQVKGGVLFEAQAVEISAQAGQMVGVEKEERLSTPWQRSFISRHPWLQLNLLTAFIAGGVVSYFQGTVDKIALLAVFLPILAGQCGNTGCQALAVTLRGLTLGEINDKGVTRLLSKEAWLGFLNGSVVGLVAAVAMFLLAKAQANPQPLGLAGITWLAMVLACTLSGLAGASVPLVMKKIGADPANASSIFLTTATDVCSMGFFLGLATLVLLH